MALKGYRRQTVGLSQSNSQKLFSIEFQKSSSSLFYSVSAFLGVPLGEFFVVFC